MKRFLPIALLAALLVAVMAAPALAAKPNVVFVTHVTADGVKLAGNSSGIIKLPTAGVPGLQAMHYLGLTCTKANPGIQDGFYGFTLQASDEQKAILDSYFQAKGWPGQYVDQIHQQLYDDAAFFYMKASGGAYSLVDGFAYGLSGGSQFLPLRIDDDYPVGTYVYAGTLPGTNGATVDLRITLKVVRAK